MIVTVVQTLRLDMQVLDRVQAAQWAQVGLLGRTCGEEDGIR